MVLFTVTTASDENDGGTGGSGLSLREALALANSSSGADTITFDAQLLSGKTISLTLGELIISDSLTLTGLGANNLSVSGNNLSRVFRVDNGSFSSALAVSLSGITLTGGNSSADGGGIFNQENLSLSDTIVTGNSAAGNGGGLFNGIGTVTLSNSTFTNNRASQDGGGLFNEGSLSASNSSFSNNAASSSGGAIANSGTATVSGSGFTGNVASQSGGGFFNNGTATVSGSSFSNNSAVNHGGGLLTVAGGTSTIEQSNFSGNSAGGNGGGLSSNLSTTSVSNSNLSGNRAGGDGGGIYSDLSTTNVSNSNLSTNSALNNGGGIASTNSSSTTLSSSSLTQNTAGNNGGGLSNSDGSFARLNNNTLNGNSAGVNGGGLTNQSGGTAIVSQNTFSHNMAANSGGGIYSQNSDTRLSNSTVTLNWAASGNGTGLFNEVGTFTATSTIVANNESNLDIGGSAFSSGGNNLIGNGSGASGFTNGVNGDLVGTAATPIDPLLGSLQNNGGSTLTHALLSGSPAINAGSNPDNLQNDQRGSGFPRTLDGATDIGAYEVQTINRLPDAVNDSANTSENTAVTINVLANDTDPDSDAVQLETFTQGANGTVTLNNNGTADKSDDTLTYTPNPNFNGHDSFTYSISDGKGGTDTATVYLTVNSDLTVLQVDKTVDRSSVKPFERVTYTYRVTAPGGAGATDIVLVDDNATPDYQDDDFQPLFVGGDADHDNVLDANETWEYKASVFPTVVMEQIVNGAAQPAGTQILEYVDSLGQVIVDGTQAGDLRATFITSENVNDNRYQESGNPRTWNRTHKFSDLLGSDNAEFQFTNRNGDVVLDFKIDYLAIVPTAPSGYATAGVKDYDKSDGKMIIGNAASVLATSTSLSNNLNSKNAQGNLVFNTAQVTVNSPTEPNPNWEYRMIYSATVDDAAFGASGFGSFAISSVHNSPSKNGYNIEFPTPKQQPTTNQVTVTAKKAINGQSLTATDTASVSVGETSPSPPTGTVDLGKAADFGLLILAKGTADIQAKNSSVVGDFGYGAMAQATKQKLEKSTFQGTALVHSTANFSVDGKDGEKFKPSGGIITNAATDALLAQANTDALNASTQLAALTPNFNLGDVNGSKKIDSIGTVTVVQIDKLNLGDKEILTLDGRDGFNDYFIINVNPTGKDVEFKLDKGKIQLVDVSPDRVVFNFAKDAKGKSIELKNGANFFGTILAPLEEVKIDKSADITGAIVTGDFQVKKDSSLNLTHVPFLPQPTSTVAVTPQVRKNTVAADVNDTIISSGSHDIFAYQAASDASGDLISVLPLLNNVTYTGSEPFAGSPLNFYRNDNNRNENHTAVTFDADGNSGAASPVTLVTLENFQGSLSYDSTRGLLGVVLPDVMPSI
jgi:hypothetical protein